MKKISLIIVLLFIFSVFFVTLRAAERIFEGDWTARLKGTKLRVEINTKDSQMSFELPLTKFQGVSSVDMNANMSDVKYDLPRDSGTFHFTGFFKQGKGMGDVAFEPNPKFISEMDKLGYRGFNSDRLLEFAIHDVTLDYVKQIK